VSDVQISSAWIYTSEPSPIPSGTFAFRDAEGGNVSDPTLATELHVSRYEMSGGDVLADLLAVAVDGIRIEWVGPLRAADPDGPALAAPEGAWIEFIPGALGGWAGDEQQGIIYAELQVVDGLSDPFPEGEPAVLAFAGVYPPSPGGPTTLLDVVAAMAEALEPLKASIPDLQVYPYLNFNPTPPSIDIYPADLFQAALGFNGDDADAYFTVRARTTTADHEAGQKALLRMLDRRAPESVEAALTLDQTLGGRVQSTAIAEDGISGYREYLEDPQANGRLIGCEWRVRVLT
jgi:hypothetical protein